MKKLSYLAPYPVYCSLYYSFIQCHMQYGITTWGSPLTKGICKIQNIIDKIVHKINKCKPANENSFKPLNINNLYKLESCKLIHQHMTNDIPTPLKCLFKKTNHNHQTRQANNNGINAIHLDRYTLPIMHFGPHFWNNYSQQIQNTESLSFSSFSSSLKKKLTAEN